MIMNHLQKSLVRPQTVDRAIFNRWYGLNQQLAIHSLLLMMESVISLMSNEMMSEAVRKGQIFESVEAQNIESRCQLNA